MTATDARLNPHDREEQANALSHALGCGLALAATPVLAAGLDANGLMLRWLGTHVFIASMALMFGVSAVYHALPPGPARQWLRRCDHAVIYLFMAGSATPFALLHAQRSGHWQVLVAVWAVAAAGMGLKLANRLRHPLVSTVLYLAFGWALLVAARPMFDALPPAGRHLLLAGGVAYSAGSLFYLAGHRVRWGHLLWHLFVIAGSALHWLAVQRALQ